MQKTVSQLMEREMTRKEFVAALGLLTVSVFGFGPLVELLTGKSVQREIHHHVKHGYGVSAYGK